MNKRIFISHASEDKDKFVRELAETLRNNNFDVWYDEYEIKPGISIRQSIDKGLASCDIGLVILSHAYLKKQWTNLELNAIFSKITSNNGKLIPLWLNITKKEIMEYSPLLADFLAIDGSKPLHKIANELKTVLFPQKTTLDKARSIIENTGLITPDFNDDWWLKVIRFSKEDAFHIPWCLPINPNEELSLSNIIGWSALRYNWIVKYSNIFNQFTSPPIIIDSIFHTPGMRDFIEYNIDCLLTYAPQLLFYENDFSFLINKQMVEVNNKIKKSASPQYKCLMTNDNTVPTCNRIYALSAVDFGGYKSSYLLQHFIEGESLGVRPSNLDYWETLILLNSEYARIYPDAVINVLLDGYKNMRTYTILSKRIIVDNLDLSTILKDSKLLKQVCCEIIEDNLSTYDLNVDQIVSGIQRLKIEESLIGEKQYRLTISNEDLSLGFRGVTCQPKFK